MFRLEGENIINELPTPKKILLATIDCIEEQGLESLTVRSIARAAGVNIAAINYYFGTKEKLVEEALRSTVDEFASLWQEAIEAEETSRERFRQFCRACMDGAHKFPGITKAHIYNPMIRDDYSGYFVKRFNDILKDIIIEIQPQAPETADRDLKMRLIQMISAAFMPALVPGLFRDFSGFSFADEEMRKQYVDYLVDQFLPE